MFKMGLDYRETAILIQETIAYFLIQQKFIRFQNLRS